MGHYYYIWLLHVNAERLRLEFDKNVKQLNKIPESIRITRGKAGRNVRRFNQHRQNDCRRL